MSMKIDNYTNSLIDMYNTQTDNTSERTSKLEGKLSGDLSTATTDELMEVCKEFEAYFTEQVFKSMQKMVPESESSDTATKTTMDYIEDMLTQEYASSSSENGGLGLAQMLYEQMKRNYNITE